MLDITASIGPDGRPDPYTQYAVDNAFAMLASRRASIKIGPALRSTSANRYYWPCVVRPIVQALQAAGYDMDSERTHDWLVRRHLGLDGYVTPDGEERTDRRRTSKLTSAEFATYIDAVCADEVVRAALDAAALRIESTGDYQRRTGQTVKGGSIKEAK